MAANSGGSLGDLSTLDELPFLEPLSCRGSAVAVAGRHFLKQLSTCQRLEHLKREKLKTARDSWRWTGEAAPPVLGTKLPPIPAAGELVPFTPELHASIRTTVKNSKLFSSTGSLLEQPHSPGPALGPVPFPSSCLVDLNSGNTLLESLWDRRDSSSSSLSSVSGLSRRSSGISPCCSSRRSSQASQFGANRPNNLSSADSYDPISADISRRSSQLSLFGEGSAGSERCGGLVGPLSLTPAQHYHLKAKYAAATGGPPPTPLPHMEPTRLRPHPPLYRHSQEFAVRSLMPHEVPANTPRRASDPVNPLGGVSLHQPQMQRYNSLGSLARTTQPHPPSSADRQDFAQHRHGGTFRHGLQPRSFSALTRKEEGTLPQFRLNSEATNRVSTNQQPAQQRRMLLTTSNTGRMCPLLGQDSGAPVLVQSDQVSVSASQLHPAPQGAGNMAVLPQIQNFGSFHNGLGSDHQTVQNLISSLQQRFWQMPDVNERTTSQHRPDKSPHDQNGNFYMAAAEASTPRSRYKQEPVDMETVGMSYADAGFQTVQVKTEDSDGSMRTPDQQNLVSEPQSCLHPRPPTGPKAQNQALSRATHQTRHFRASNQDAASNLSHHRASGDSVLCYTGQIHVFEPSANLARDFSPMLTLSSFEKHAAPPGGGDSQLQACVAAMAQTQIDFDTMLDDRSSLLSGALSPALLQDLSQSSSRLTTPRTSATLPSLPATTANMAIGDMSSLLSTLAEESNILTLMT